MENLNIFNLEEIIFLNQKIQEYLRLEKKIIYDEWQKCLFSNNKSKKLKFYMEFLNVLLDEKFKENIEKILGYNVKIDIFNDKIVDHFDISKEDLYNVLCKDKVKNYSNIVLYRKGNNFKVTVWR